MRFRSTAREDDDSDGSSDDGKGASKQGRRARPSRQARFIVIEAPSVAPTYVPDIVASASSGYSNYPPRPPVPQRQQVIAQESTHVTPGDVPVLATVNAGDVPGPFDILPRGTGQLRLG
jgi:hypothetical protein